MGSVVLTYAVYASAVMWAFAFIGGVHCVAHFNDDAAYMAFCGVGAGMVGLVMGVTTPTASLLFFALVGVMVETPAVAALSHWGMVLEGSDRAVPSKCCEELLVENLSGYSFVREGKHQG